MTQSKAELATFIGWSGFSLIVFMAFTVLSFIVFFGDPSSSRYYAMVCMVIFFLLAAVGLYFWGKMVLKKVRTSKTKTIE